MSWDRTVSGRRMTGVCTHWTGTGRFWYKIQTVPGRTSYDVWKAPGTFQNILTNRPMPGRAPDDVLWVELPPVKNDVYLQKNILNLHTYFTSEDQKNTNIYFLQEHLRVNSMQRTSAIDIVAVFSKFGFYLHNCQSQPQCLLYKQPVCMEE